MLPRVPSVVRPLDVSVRNLGVPGRGFRLQGHLFLPVHVLVRFAPWCLWATSSTTSGAGTTLALSSMLVVAPSKSGINGPSSRSRRTSSGRYASSCTWCVGQFVPPRVFPRATILHLLRGFFKGLSVPADRSVLEFRTGWKLRLHGYSVQRKAVGVLRDRRWNLAGGDFSWS